MEGMVETWSPTEASVGAGDRRDMTCDVIKHSFARGRSVIHTLALEVGIPTKSYLRHRFRFGQSCSCPWVMYKNNLAHESIALHPYNRTYTFATDHVESDKCGR